LSSCTYPDNFQKLILSQSSTSLSDWDDCFLRRYSNAGNAGRNCQLYAIEKQSIPFQEPHDEVLGLLSPSPAPHEDGFGLVSPTPHEDGIGLPSPSFEPQEEPQEEDVILIVPEVR
jgi:hypothetical protein